MATIGISTGGTELSDDRLLLRPPVLDDVPALVAALQDPEIPHWIAAIPQPFGEQDATWFVTDICEVGWATGHGATWVVVDVADGSLLGCISLTARLEGVAEIGFWLDRAARGCGVMTDAVGLVCDFAFGALGLHRVEWQAVVGNDASRAVARRAGFREEGIVRGRLAARDGGGSDAWIAGLLATDARPASQED